MAAIRPCTGTTADWKAVEDTLILKEREIGVEIDTSGHYQIRQGDGKKKFFDLPIIVNNARYEEILTLTQGYMNTVNNFSKNMTEAANSANSAAATANNAASTASAAAKACQGIVKSKKKLHKMHRAIETYLNENLDLEIKGDWQVFRFEYPVMKDGKPVFDENGKQVTKGRMLDFMGFQFHHDRTTIRKSNIEAARRKANHISKQDKISWYNASVMLSYMGLFKHTDTYNYYIEYIKPKINVKKLKRIVSKHSRKENEQHDRLEKGDRNTAGQAGGGRQDIVAVNGLPA